MTRKFKAIIIAVVVLTGTAAVTINNDKLFEISKNLEIFISVYKELNNNFADELDPGTLMRTAIDAMTKSLDPYTNYMSESQMESYWISDDDRYQGIGAKINLIDKNVTVTEVYEGGPAAEAGIKVGDIITSLNGIDIKGKKIEDINVIMRGIPGTDILLGIQSSGSPSVEPKTITRGEVNIPNVPYSGFVSEDVGYISLTIFTQNASDNVKQALRKLKEENPNLAGVILDLRHNGGGLLHEAINICNIFMPQGEIVVTTKSKIKENDQVYRTTLQPEDLELPVAVLIDNKSASASEIVSGTLQDVDRAVLIGQRSFGKGLVQSTKDLPYHSRLKLTISKYYIPSGRCIQGVEYENGIPVDIPDNRRSKFKTKNGRTVLDGGGVTPDIKLPAPELPAVVNALNDQYIIFKYVNEYCKNKDKIDPIASFRFTQFDDFLNFVKKSNFKYETEAEKILNNAKAAFEKSGSNSVVNDIKTLQDKIIADRPTELQRSKDAIIKEIEKEIVSRYYYQKGKIHQALDNDPEISEAVAVLKDTNRYKKILSGK